MDENKLPLWQNGHILHQISIGGVKMRYVIEYIPLNKIKPGLFTTTTPRAKELQKAAADCMHLLIVKKDKKEGGYVVISGNSNLDYLKKHTKKKYAACIVDRSNTSAFFTSLLQKIRKPKLPYDVPFIKRERTAANSWSIIRTFLKKEPRFRLLTRSQQMKVIWMGVRYKNTTVSSMRKRVDEWLKDKHHRSS
jgi:hypothetical protein